MLKLINKIFELWEKTEKEVRILNEKDRDLILELLNPPEPNEKLKVLLSMASQIIGNNDSKKSNNSI